MVSSSPFYFLFVVLAVSAREERSYFKPNYPHCNCSSLFIFLQTFCSIAVVF